MNRLRWVLPLLAAGLVLMPAIADAQYPGGSTGGTRGGMGAGRPAPRDGRDVVPDRAPDATELIQMHLHELEDDLKLTPAERKAWLAYSDRVRQLAADIARNHLALRFPKGAAPQQFDALADALRNRLTAFEDIVDAGKALYAALTPEQQEIADRRLARVAVSLIDTLQSPSVDFAGGLKGGARRPTADR